MALHRCSRFLPVTIDGTIPILPAGGLKVRRGNMVAVTISPPIDPASYGLERVRELIVCVRETIGRHLTVAQSL